MKKILNEKDAKKRLELILNLSDKAIKNNLENKNSILEYDILTLIKKLAQDNIDIKENETQAKRLLKRGE